MAYGARLESVLGASPHGFESHILRALRKKTFTNETVKNPLSNQRVLSYRVDRSGKARTGFDGVVDCAKLHEVLVEQIELGLVSTGANANDVSDVIDSCFVDWTMGGQTHIDRVVFDAKGSGYAFDSFDDARRKRCE